jgi:toxin-antitoxin system PIN domain toxin
MTLVDANLLLYARDSDSTFHDAARSWLTDQLNGSTRVGLPWQCLVAFVRISTHPRAYEQPLSGPEAWRQVEEWLDAEVAWIPAPTTRHADVLGTLIRRYGLRGNLVSDAHLAALAVEHGLTLYSADTDFARFGEVRWIDPLASERLSKKIR